jgi:hypothetical protein
MFSRRFSLSVAKPVSTIPEGFVACPMLVVSGYPVQQDRMREIYQLAYERACELHRPSRWAPLYDVCPN